MQKLKTDETFKKFWEIQKEFNNKFFDVNELRTAERVSLTKEMLLHMLSEVDELLTATGNWKMHKRGKYGPLISGIAEELIDMFKYLINIAVIWNIKPEQFVETFEKKTSIVEFQYAQTENLRSLQYAPVIVVDLDGTLNTYPSEWLSYLRQETGFTFNTVKQAKKVLHKRYYELKRKYLEGGLETSVAANKKLIDVLNSIKKTRRDIKIVVLTSRPVWLAKRYYADTLEWLHKHEVPFDALLWNFDKAEEITEFKKVLFAVEDELIFANNLAINGYTVLLLDRIYNQGDVLKNVIRVKDEDIETIIYNILQKNI